MLHRFALLVCSLAVYHCSTRPPMISLEEDYVEGEKGNNDKTLASFRGTKCLLGLSTKSMKLVSTLGNFYDQIRCAYETTPSEKKGKRRARTPK